MSGPDPVRSVTDATATKKNGPLFCDHCDYAAPRLIYGLCDACNKYVKRHGKARPQHLIDRTADRRYRRAVKAFGLDW